MPGLPASSAITPANRYRARALASAGLAPALATFTHCVLVQVSHRCPPHWAGLRHGAGPRQLLIGAGACCPGHGPGAHPPASCVAHRCTHRTGFRRVREALRTPSLSSLRPSSLERDGGTRLFAESKKSIGDVSRPLQRRLRRLGIAAKATP